MSNDKKIVFLVGRLVNLCPIDKTEVPLYAQWINDPEIREFVAQSFPKTIWQEEGWCDKIGSDDKNVVLCIETKVGVPIGIMGIHNIEWTNRVATTGALIGEKEYWNKGYGTDAKMTLLDYGFNTLNLRKVCSSVVAYNKRSLAYSLHCGYKVEGRKRKQLYKKGKYHDLIELGLFREEWLPIWKKYKRTGKVH